MENQIPQIPTVPVVDNQQTITPEQPKKNNLLTILLSVLLFISLAINGFFVYQTQKTNFEPGLKPDPELTSEPELEPELIPLEILTKDWEIQRVEKLGIEFKLPKYLSSLDYPNGNETLGEKGKQFCIEYIKIEIISFIINNAIAGGGACLPQYFGLGTTSVDYEAGRMSGFGDLQGYTYENGKYLAKMGLNKKLEIPTGLVKEITNSNDVKILRVIGKNNSEQDQNFPIGGTPGDGRIGALININDTTYSGFSINMQLDEKLDTKLFDQILSTFKFIN